VGHAQWVFTVPKMLRVYLLHHRELLGALSLAAYETVKELMAAAAVEEEDFRPGVVSVVQTFGDRANFHPHVHALASREGWTASGDLSIVNLPRRLLQPARLRPRRQDGSACVESGGRGAGACDGGHCRRGRFRHGMRRAPAGHSDRGRAASLRNRVGGLHGRVPGAGRRPGLLRHLRQPGLGVDLAAKPPSPPNRRIRNRGRSPGRDALFPFGFRSTRSKSEQSPPRAEGRFGS
jgi:hypothetical protein